MPLFALCALSAFAQDQQPPQEDINLDFGLDEFIYQPTFTFTLGARMLSGVKSSFSGSGTVNSYNQIGALGDSTAVRYYHDGTVAPDHRTDLNGNPVAPDGYTNNWSFADNRQALGDGFLAMNTYSAEVLNTGAINQNPKSSLGVEVQVSRDMGKLFGKLPWTLIGGMSVNDVRANFRSQMDARITKTTDLYYFANGVSAPNAPYNAPGAYTDANGNSFDTALISSQPLARTTTGPTFSNTAVANTWKLHGAFYSFRAGPSVAFPITANLKATVSVGAVLVYAGSTYTVDQIFQPETSSEIVASISDGVSEILPGYYVDGNLEYTFTERAGLYIGGVYQHAGAYTQTITSADGTYSTRVDLSSLQGVRAGMTFRF
ncbi:hypothetical protein K0B96_08465 [Horticoccus luteus]|uniref:Uncharacterized protein n=1 Tax=Horticoccus luteus TaxID=2862869 RepID=A0A8F9XMZ4_9BACT|nr:hypothetical protein [Horticoccus luteus]QYM80619.1 hypothetical protein K0B96_08465 [Horticoccus luteus]